MGIPNDPTVADICTEALKKGGRVNPSQGDINDATNIHFQEVKADIYLKSPRHKTLETTICIPVTLGISRYNFPTNCEDIESIQLVDAPTSGFYVSTAQAGGAQTIQLNAGYSDTSGGTIGRSIFLISGTGSTQYAQIAGYVDGSKQVTIESPWATLNPTWVSPDNTTGYLIENIRYKLWEWDKPVQWDTSPAPFQQGTPNRCALMDRQIWLDKTPDRSYAMVITFWYALDQLDETSSLFTHHLRKFRSMWVQGVAAKVSQRFDDARSPAINNLYNFMLDMYGASSAQVGQVIFQDY